MLTVTPTPCPCRPPAAAAAGLVFKVRSLVDLYAALRVPRDRLLFRLPATWAGTQAAHTLETEGIETTVRHAGGQVCVAAAPYTCGSSVVICQCWSWPSK